MILLLSEVYKVVNDLLNFFCNYVDFLLLKYYNASISTFQLYVLIGFGSFYKISSIRCHWGAVLILQTICFS